MIFKASDIPSAISSMITKSGLLVFLKSCCNSFWISKPNDIALALPSLLTRIFKGFLASSSEWDGKVDRSTWLNQFFGIGELLVQILPDLSNHSIEWKSTMICKILEFVSVVSSHVKHDRNLISIKSLLSISTIIKSVKETPKELPNEFDSDGLYFTFDFATANHFSAYWLQELLCNIKPIHEELVVWTIQQQRITIAAFEWYKSVVKSGVMNPHLWRVFQNQTSSPDERLRILARDSLLLSLKIFEKRKGETKMASTPIEMIPTGTYSEYAYGYYLTSRLCTASLNWQTCLLKPPHAE